jgi:uncharacterized delta-60 repeat protein
MKKIVLFMLLAMSMTGTAIAQFGALDLTFNPSGTSTSGDVYNVATQPDGKVLVGGLFPTYQGIAKSNLVRLNQDGSLDNSFPAQFENTVRQIIVLPNGKILVAGAFVSCSTGSGSVTVRGIARLNADGTFDNTFNPGGFGISQPVNVGGIPIVVSMKVQSDGKIVIAGDFKSYNGTMVNCIARLNADGALDNTFNVAAGANFPLDAIAIQADNKIVVGGLFTLFNGTSAGHLARLNTDGSVDNTFNIGGAGLDGGYITVYKLEVQPDGKIIAGGSFSAYNGTSFNNFIRLNTNGSVDNTFNPGGAGPSDQVFDVSLLPDNRILISGLMNSYNGTSIGRVTCLNIDGSLDNTFNTGGTGANDLVFSISQTADNKIVIGGVFGSYNGTTMQRVARLNAVACTPATGIDVQTACESYTWIDGMTYITSNNTATDTIIGGAANGCDSIVTLNLTINHPATGTDVQTACDSYIWIDGVTYITSNNTATDTIIGGAVNGCDSIVTLNLTINHPATGTDVQTGCYNYMWIDGMTYTMSNNTATHTIIGGAANGCDSVVTLNLTMQTINTNVTLLGSTIQAQLAGASYQWINCATNTPIPGATGGTYTATANGNYAVIITVNNCSDTSLCIQVAHLGIEEIAGWNTTLYPNPSNGTFTIDWGTEVDNMFIEITDVTGKPVYHSVALGAVSHVVDMKEAVGIYYVTLSNGKQRRVIKVICN